jgi:hypothetical protein
METIFRLKDSFFEYLSPVAKRRRTTGPSTPSHEDQEPKFATPSTEPQGRKGKVIAIGKFSKVHHEVHYTNGINSRKRRREDDDGNPKIERESAISIRPDESASNISPYTSEESFVEGEDDESSPIDVKGSKMEDVPEVDEGDLYDGMTAAEREEAEAAAKVEDYLARQAELAARMADIEKARVEKNWHPDAFFLFERFCMRAFEPVIPKEYAPDFRTLPDDLFTEPENAFVNYHTDSLYPACRALLALHRLGLEVRMKIEVGRPVDRYIVKQITDYMKWAERDGGYRNLRFIPVLTVVAAKTTQTTSSMVASVFSEMKFLAERHREHLAALPGSRINSYGHVEYARPPPLLYGIVVANANVILVTLDSAGPDATLEHIQHFDLTRKAEDVWNGFAIAYTVIMARNYIMSIKDTLEEDDYAPDDVDA